MVALVPPATGVVASPAKWPVTEPAVTMVNWSPSATLVATVPDRAAPPRLTLPVTWNTSLVGVPGFARLTKSTSLPFRVALDPVSVPIVSAGKVTPGLMTPAVPAAGLVEVMAPTVPVPLRVPPESRTGPTEPSTSTVPAAITVRPCALAGVPAGKTRVPGSTFVRSRPAPVTPPERVREVAAAAPTDEAVANWTGPDQVLLPPAPSRAPWPPTPAPLRVSRWPATVNPAGVAEPERAGLRGAEGDDALDRGGPGAQPQGVRVADVEDALEHLGGPGVGVRPGQHRLAGADLGQPGRGGLADRPGDGEGVAGVGDV